MDYEKISFNMDKELAKEIRLIMSEPPFPKRTDVINSLLWKGLKYDEQINGYKNQNEYIALKTLYILRKVAGTRGEEFLQQIDAEFEKEKNTMKSLVSNGVDYV